MVALLVAVRQTVGFGALVNQFQWMGGFVLHQLYKQNTNKQIGLLGEDKI